MPNDSIFGYCIIDRITIAYNMAFSVHFLGLYLVPVTVILSVIWDPVIMN